MPYEQRDVPYGTTLKQLLELAEAWGAPPEAEVRAEISYDCSIATLSWTRPETLEEVAAREANEVVRLENEARQKRAIYEALKREFEGE
jgi:hypothetical protein